MLHALYLLLAYDVAFDEQSDNKKAVGYHFCIRALKKYKDFKKGNYHHED
jgi:hypothetical protein